MNPRLASLLELIDFFWLWMVLIMAPLLMLFETWNRGEFF